MTTARIQEPDNPHAERIKRYRAGLEHATSLGEAMRWRSRLASEARAALFVHAITFEEWREVNDYITHLTNERAPQWIAQGDEPGRT
jgi:hypothetical protein